jgi:HK97 gp10 family phage protein
MAQNYTSRTKIKITGVDEFKKNIEKVNKDVIKILPDAVMAGAEIIRDAAKAKVHSRSGLLEAGIKAEITWDKNAPVAWAGAGFDREMNDVFVKYSKAGKRYYYPAAVEYGHKGPHPAPKHSFMRSALDENKAKIRAEIKNRVKAAIEGAVK